MRGLPNPARSYPKDNFFVSDYLSYLCSLLYVSSINLKIRLELRNGLFHLIGIHPLLMTFVPGEDELALGCPRGLKCWLSQAGSQAFWPVPGGSKAFVWLSKGGSEALRPVPGGSKCHVPGGWLQMANCSMGVQA